MLFLLIILCDRARWSEVLVESADRTYRLSESVAVIDQCGRVSELCEATSYPDKAGRLSEPIGKIEHAPRANHII